MRQKTLIFVLAFAFLAQCGAFPQLPADTGFGGPGNGSPRLLPMSMLPEGAKADVADSEAARLLARATGLKTKAQALRGAVLTPRERRILRRAMARHSG